MADTDLGAVLEALNNKVDLPTGDSQDGIDYVVDWQKPTESNGYTWYRKYKSGWVEQGGQVDKSAGSTAVAVTFPVAFGITPTVVITKIIDSAATDQNTITIRTISLTSFTMNKLTTNNAAYWQASGMGA